LNKNEVTSSQGEGEFLPFHCIDILSIHVRSPQSEGQPTSSEQLAIDSEMEGAVFGEMKSEEKRQKDEQWAQFKDANPRGAGNTMNRG
jgi:hypothetical protein